MMKLPIYFCDIEKPKLFYQDQILYRNRIMKLYPHLSWDKLKKITESIRHHVNHEIDQINLLEVNHIQCSIEVLDYYSVTIVVEKKSNDSSIYLS